VGVIGCKNLWFKLAVAVIGCKNVRLNSPCMLGETSCILGAPCILGETQCILGERTCSDTRVRQLQKVDAILGRCPILPYLWPQQSKH
jgi:hypothetical protein